VCESYHAIDDFRTKLLGLLPVATGTGVFLLLSSNTELISQEDVDIQPVLGAIGAFGLIFTVGLFAYELFGIKKCHYLIETGRGLEAEFGIHGQFRSRPAAVASFVAEPFASSIIYPASMAAWLFLALVSTPGQLAAAAAVVVFVVGVAATMWGAWRIKENQERDDALLNSLRRTLHNRGKVPLHELERQLDLSQERKSLDRLQKRGDLIIDDSFLRLIEPSECRRI
jgi:hypothetical protein